MIRRFTKSFEKSLKRKKNWKHMEETIIKNSEMSSSTVRNSNQETDKGCCECQRNKTADPNKDAKVDTQELSSPAEDTKYWKTRYEKLLSDYTHLQKINQNLEEKLLALVESFERKKEELVANIEFEKSTLMADVNKLSTKLVDARIKLHDYEEKELLHASECNAPCHRNCPDTNTNKLNGTKDQTLMNFDPNLV